jgi:cyclophilin family peptidyl-prolyl cis-trans isomerase
MRRANVLIVILLATLALALVACGENKKSAVIGADTTGSAAPQTTPATTTATTAAPAAADGCTPVRAPAPRANTRAKRPTKILSAKRTWFATIKTNCGTMKIRLDVRHAPKTTSSVASLARQGYFDGLTFHRIASSGGQDFVIQGGDPLGNGQGDPGYRVVEPAPKSTRYTHYLVAMAKSGSEAPGTSGSQFFIVTGADTGLPPDYAIVGRVTGGKDVVDRISKVPKDANDAPLAPVVMSSVRISSTG